MELKELISRAADGEAISMVRASALSFSAGLSTEDFSKAVDICRRRKEALKAIDAATAAKAKLATLNAQRSDLLRDMLAEKARLQREFDEACNGLQAEYDQFIKQTAAEHTMLSGDASRYHHAVELLRTTADKQVLEQLRAARKLMEQVQTTAQIAEQIANDPKNEHELREATAELQAIRQQEQELEAEIGKLEAMLNEAACFSI